MWANSPKKQISLENKLQSVATKDTNKAGLLKAFEKKLADLEKSKIGVNLAKAKLLKKEQEVILSAAEAFTGVILANKKFKINKENLDFNPTPCQIPSLLPLHQLAGLLD